MHTLLECKGSDLHEYISQTFSGVPTRMGSKFDPIFQEIQAHNAKYHNKFDE